MNTPINPPRRLRRPALLSVFCLLFASCAFGNTWINPSGGIWTSGANWNESAAPNGTDAIADFSQVDVTSGLSVHLDASQSVGGLLFGDADTNTPAVWTLDNNGSAANVLTLDVSSGEPSIFVTNAAIIDVKIAGVAGMGKYGPGTLTVSNIAYTGQTTVSNGTLVLAGSSLLSGGGDLWLGSPTAANNSQANIVSVGAVQTVSNFVTVGTAGSQDQNGNFTTNNVTTNLVTIPSGSSLRVQRNVLFGYLNANGIYTNYVTFTGGGSFVQKLDGDADPNTPINFQVGADNLSSGQTGPRAMVDMSGLSSLELNLGINNSTAAGSVYHPLGAVSLVNAPAGSLIVGDVMKSGAGGELCSLALASNNVITANLVMVGLSRAAGFVETLILGSGTNVFNVNTNSLGAVPNIGGREGGRMFFATPAGSFKLRAQDGVGRSAFYVAGTRSSNPGRSLALGLSMSSAQYADFSGHDADLLLSILVVGDERHGNFTLPSEYWTNYFNFDQGTLDTTELQLGMTRAGADGTNYFQSTCNLNGGTVIIGTNGISMAQIMANIANPTTPAGRQFLYTNNSTLNIGGGSLTVNGNINVALQSTTNMFYDYGTLNITGGSVTVNGNIFCGTPGSLNFTLPLAPRLATLNLDGGTLDLTGHAIGSHPLNTTITNNYLDQINLLSGTLQNVSEINNGATRLVKSGAGTLILSGSNSYTAGTLVSSGTLQVTHDSALGIGGVEVASGASLQLQGGANNTYFNPTARLLLDSGAAVANLNFTGVPAQVAALSFDGGATLQASGTWGSTASGAQHQDDVHFSGTGTLLVSGSVTPPPASPIQISLSGGNLSFQITNTLAGTNYVLLTATNLNAPWAPVLTNTGNGGTLIFGMPVDPATPQLFFRYLLQ